MGIGAGQARLLSITARLTDNEQVGQSVSYSKQRLADQTDQINAEYLEALSATKLTVLTGFSGAEPNYTDISYGVMTGFDTVSASKQYIVTDAKGRLLVTEQQARAFEDGNGDLNRFLAYLGYDQADLQANKNTGTDEQKETARTKVHEAWDKYFQSVGHSINDGADSEHSIEYDYNSFDSNTAYSGYATTTINGVTNAINFEGTTKEQRELYDYAVALTQAYYDPKDKTTVMTGPSGSKTIDLKNASNADNVNKIAYLKNIFYKMQSSDYFCYTTTLDYSNKNPDNHKYVEDMSKTPINDNKSFEDKLKNGQLQLEYYSATEKKFISTSLSDDSSIQEVEDTRKISLVEAKYTMDMTNLEKRDKRFDLELKKLDTEHNALQTEYDSVKSVIDKNIEKTFTIFS